MNPASYGQDGESAGLRPEVTYLRMLAFFVPLGLSASLVTLSHVIINSTLARSAHPEYVISSYAIAMSLLSITERPALLLRQTCSALVRDRKSFRAMSIIALAVFASILAAGAVVAYSPVGRFVFSTLFGAKDQDLAGVLGAYRVLMFVSIFSGIRCLFHGIIIYNKRTFWLTIGMFIRLVGMYALSRYYLAADRVDSGKVGAVIFLVGMMIEASLSVWEGLSLVRKKLPEKEQGHPVEQPSHIFRFYRPLLYSSFIAIAISPAINSALANTDQARVSIAAFAIASSLVQLTLSFFSYIHQIVLNFERAAPSMVLRFVTPITLIPGLLVTLLAYTTAGPWVMMHVIGAKNELLQESIHALRMFILLAFLTPWLDFGNGRIMLRGQTRQMVWSQSANVAVTIASLVLLLWLAPYWNARVGALAQSLGVGAELAVVAVAVIINPVTKRGKASVSV